MELQRRFTTSAAARPRMQARADGSGKRIIGYAAVFYRATDLEGTQFEIMPGHFERIAPGAFDRALREDDPMALFNHDAAMVLGRKSSGTLRLSVDAVGLRYEIDAPDTSTGRDVVELLRRGDVCGSSFAFVPLLVSRDDSDDNHTISWLKDVQLFDVGPVTYPAYSGTSSGVRGRGPRGRSAQADKDLLAVTLASMEPDGPESPDARRVRRFLAHAEVADIDRVLRSMTDAQSNEWDQLKTEFQKLNEQRLATEQQLQAFEGDDENENDNGDTNPTHGVLVAY